MSICTLCKTQIPEAALETWKTPSGDAVQVARSVTPSAVAETSVGEFEICEACYRRGLPPFFTPQDLAMIHYEFGLEYSHCGQFARSVESLTQARRISETADVVAALAHAEDALGHRGLAIAHYRRALEIDPSHFMSRQNLQRLYEGAA
jgi:tetratricopeptide (TPR) repeat protein